MASGEWRESITGHLAGARGRSGRIGLPWYPTPVVSEQRVRMLLILNGLLETRVRKSEGMLQSPSSRCSFGTNILVGYSQKSDERAPSRVGVLQNGLKVGKVGHPTPGW